VAGWLAHRRLSVPTTPPDAVESDAGEADDADDAVDGRGAGLSARRRVVARVAEVVVVAAVVVTIGLKVRLAEPEAEAELFAKVEDAGVVLPTLLGDGSL